LGIFTFVCCLWVTDISICQQKAWNSLREDVATALRALPPREFYSARTQAQVVTLKQLEQTGKLSATARKWLRDSTMYIQAVEVRGGSPVVGAKQGEWFTVSIHFRDGGQDFVPPFLVFRSRTDF
jgi:hypothetical protein